MKERNLGIDALRINCYAIISGYVGAYGKVRYYKLAGIWIHLFFYVLIITLLFLFIKPEVVTWQDIFCIIFPISSEKNWYLTSYFGMFIFLPLINNAIQQITQKDFIRVLMTTLLFLSIILTITTLPPFSLTGNPYKLNSGYSMIWLSVLYIIGGYIKKYDLQKRIRLNISILAFAMLIMVTWFSKYLLERVQLKDYSKAFVNYTSPTIIFAAIFLFLAFSNIKIKHIFVKKTIQILSPLTLGVFIIHTEPLIWSEYVKDCAAGFVNKGTGLMIMGMFFYVFLIYLLCSAIDLVRLKFFTLLKIQERLQNLEKKIICRYD